MMDCHEIETRLRAYIDGELPVSVERAVRAHLNSCRGCQAPFEQLAATVHLLQEIPLEEPPPHFSASLQVRLAARRHVRALSGPRRVVPVFLCLPGARPALRYGMTAAIVAACFLGLFGLAQPRIGAAELVGKVQESWARLRNYQCTFVSRGIVRGEPREFAQRQWFQKPNLFRLETREHYTLITYVERDRVGLLIPGADWQGRPVAVLRSRKQREPGLPFPFGSLWPESEDISIDALVRELRAQRGARVLGTETVLDKPCHVLKFHSTPPGGRRTVHYLMWIDQESFLPLKAKLHEDANNHLMTEAVDLRINTVFPSDTFRFQPPGGTFLARGDVHPDVFALKPIRPEAFDRWPVRTARRVIASRGRMVPFRPVAPTYLPPEYALLRVRAARGRWLDAYWVDSESGRIVKLVEQSAGAVEPAETRDGSVVTIPCAGGARNARLAQAGIPYSHHYLSWQQDGVSALLATSELPLTETLRIAGSMEPIETEPAASASRQEPEGRTLPAPTE